MIALVLLACMSDPVWFDAVPDAMPDAVASAPVTPIAVFADQIHPLAKEAAIDEAASCGSDFCAARRVGLPDESDIKASRPLSVRRFQPLRNLFRGRR